MSVSLETTPANPPVSSGFEASNVLPMYDALRERRIKALARLVNAARAAGDIAEAHRICQELFASIQTRSPEQVSRMEKAMGKEGFNSPLEISLNLL